MRKKARSIKTPKVGNIITKAGSGGASPSIPIWKLIVGKPIFPAGIEGVRKNASLNTEGLDLALIENLSEPILPDHVGVAINLNSLDTNISQRRLVWLGEEAPLIHDLWLGMTFVAFNSIQILVTKDDPEDPDEFQSFLLPTWVA